MDRTAPPATRVVSPSPALARAALALAALATLLAPAACRARRDEPAPSTSAPASSAGAAGSGAEPVAPKPAATAVPPSPSPSAIASASATPRAPDGMLLVPAGPFTMGADDVGERDERPAHEVTLGAFFLDATEVTNAAYEECVRAKACRPHEPRSAVLNHYASDAPFRGPRQPISAVTWDDARAYCAWRGKRLPTEAEFEKAARGTDARRYPWGNDEPTKERAVFGAGVTGDVGTHPAGDGPYGHHDLAGNVWEWIEDAYDPYAYQRPGAKTGQIATCEDALAALKDLKEKHVEGYTGSNPLPEECERVLRGGAFNYGGKGLRSSNRVHHPGRFQLVMSGLRCAKDAAP